VIDLMNYLCCQVGMLLNKTMIWDVWFWNVKSQAPCLLAIISLYFVTFPFCNFSLIGIYDILVKSNILKIWTNNNQMMWTKNQCKTILWTNPLSIPSPLIFKLEWTNTHYYTLQDGCYVDRNHFLINVFMCIN